MLITNPTVNSYKRLIIDAISPMRPGVVKRSAMVRIPTHKPSMLPTRAELHPDPTANPYLANAVAAYGWT